MREKIKSFLHSVFVLGQRFGWDILPRHFYSSIPDIRQLRRSESWRLPSSMIGVAGADIELQMSFVQDCCAPLIDRIKQGGIHEHACKENGAVGYGRIEAEFLYSFIAAKRPGKIVQIGCGVSTSVILLAAKETGYKPQIVCIDPYPTEYLTRAADQKLIELQSIPAQEVDIGVLTALEAGDLFFVDSSHTVRPGSEVNRIVLEVLPRLPSGSFAHFHDIYFPYDYQSNVLDSVLFWEESSLLHAFLIDNKRCAIAASLSMLHHACPARLQSLFPGYRPAKMQYGLHSASDDRGHFPSSFYLSVA
jgi:hypothetical protein